MTSSASSSAERIAQRVRRSRRNVFMRSILANLEAMTRSGAHFSIRCCQAVWSGLASTTLADFYGSFVAIVYGNAGMLAAEAD